MEKENEKPDESLKESASAKSVKKDYPLAATILVAGMLLSSWIYSAGLKASDAPRGRNIVAGSETTQISALEEVLPSGGVLLPIQWSDLGAKLVSVGAIDAQKFRDIYQSRGAFGKEYEELLSGQNDSKLKMTNDNAGYLLNLFWALGLASKNPILDSGEMKDTRYGGAGNFASTGGWTIAKGNPMDHYSRHMFFALTPEQQSLVDKVSQGIYRSCCGNSTHFPDCNHGMAMLGLLELMASQGVSEEDMWKTALAVNSYWFPDTYLTIATYMKNKGIDWSEVNPQEILGANYSSASGYRRIASQVTKPQEQSGGSECGVDTGEPAAQRHPVLPEPKRGGQSGCGV